MSEREWLGVFARNLLQLMMDRMMTQKELAELSGLSEGTISKYIRNMQMPGPKALVNLAYALSCTLDDLMDFGEKVR